MRRPPWVRPAAHDLVHVGEFVNVEDDPSKEKVGFHREPPCKGLFFTPQKIQRNLGIKICPLLIVADQ